MLFSCTSGYYRGKYSISSSSYHITFVITCIIHSLSNKSQGERVQLYIIISHILPNISKIAENALGKLSETEKAVAKMDK